MTHYKLISLLILSVCHAGAALAAPTPGDQKGGYLGVFGGLGELDSTSLRQIGTVRLPHPLPHLPIDADGDTDRSDVALGGVQLGYQWSGWHAATSGWGLQPAVEIEGLYLGKETPEATMPIQPQFLGTQYVTADIDGHVLLANVVLTLKTPWSQRLFPYAGVGAGTARLSLTDADSANPSEPGINHFNSDPDASDTAAALQFKLGMKGALSERLALFAEYRYLTIDATRYTFGATVYPGQHPPTDAWDVRLGELEYSLFVAGLQYRF